MSQDLSEICGLLRVSNLGYAWLSHKPELRLYFEMKRLLSFLFGLSAAVPIDVYHSMPISDFTFQILLLFALFQEVVYYKKLQYITKLRENKTTNYTDHQR